jgi:hypothetical protein
VYRKIFKFNLKWHNLSGSWLIVVLLLTTLTGIFLRPPLLITIANSRVGKIPYSILDNTPMSLWNLCLEIHTCRIYEPLIGLLYVLLIPLFGLGIMFVLVTGFFSWYLGRRRST